MKLDLLIIPHKKTIHNKLKLKIAFQIILWTESFAILKSIKQDFITKHWEL
jgi:hypothetical protein